MKSKWAFIKEILADYFRRYNRIHRYILAVIQPQPIQTCLLSWEPSDVGQSCECIECKNLSREQLVSKDFDSNHSFTLYTYPAHKSPKQRQEPTSKVSLLSVQAPSRQEHIHSRCQRDRECKTYYTWEREREIERPVSKTISSEHLFIYCIYLNHIHQLGTERPKTCNAKNPSRIHSVTPHAARQPENAKLPSLSWWPPIITPRNGYITPHTKRMRLATCMAVVVMDARTMPSRLCRISRRARVCVIRSKG